MKSRSIVENQTWLTKLTAGQKAVVEGNAGMQVLCQLRFHTSKEGGLRFHMHVIFSAA